MISRSGADSYREDHMHFQVPAGAEHLEERGLVLREGCWSENKTNNGGKLEKPLRKERQFTHIGKSYCWRVAPQQSSLPLVICTRKLKKIGHII